MDIENIYNLYFKDVYIYLISLTKDSNLSEDITQETFLKVMRNIDKFDGAKDIRAWIFTIARNTYYTFYKREKIYTTYEENTSEANSGDMLKNYIEKETVSDIEKVLDDMDEPYKSIFIHRHYQELSYEEIAKIYGKTSGWSRTIFFRAKKKILERMSETVE